MSTTHPADALRDGFSGQLLGPEQPGYDEARRVFNAMIDRRPALIARCASTADVVAAVHAAREHGLAVAVRGGGHSFSGLSTCDDGILIDLGGLKSIAVDPRARTARAGGGVLWGEFDAATQAHGLHTPGGRVTTTGLGGFTTGGGYGWTSSKYGLACDNLVSAEVVLADGRVVRASEREHADLFWGIRGGSGNFGIVTEFEFRLHPLGPTVLAGLMVFPVDRAPEVLPRLARLGRRRARRGVHRLRRDHRAARAVRPGGAARPAGARHTRALRRRPGGRGGGGAAAQGPRPRRGPRRPDALHRLPGGPRPARPARLPQLRARRVHVRVQRRRDRRRSSPTPPAWPRAARR